MGATDTRSDVYSLDNGRQFVVTYPADATSEEADEFSDWLELVVRKVARRAGAGAPDLGAHVTAEELAGLKRQNLALAERVAAQSELLSKRAEVPAPGNARPPAPTAAREVKPRPVFPRRSPGDVEREFRPASVYMLPILRALGVEEEPVTMEYIGLRVEKDPAYWSKPFKACPWFECANPEVLPGRGRPRLWRLTEAGRAAFAKLPPATGSDVPGPATS